MSTYWYFECLDHTPALRSRDEFTQHTRDRHWDRALRLASSRPADIEDVEDSHWYLEPTDEQWADAYFSRNAWAFLTNHPTCRLGVVSEYGARERLPYPEGRESDDA